MKITFLGTAPALMQKDRHCTAHLIETNGCFYLLDAGAPICDLLVRKDIGLNNIKAIFTTHCHDDHILGILPYITLHTWAYKNDVADIYLTDKKMVDLIQMYLDVTLAEKTEIDENHIRLNVIDKNFKYEDENIKVGVIETKHMKNSKSYAYEIIDKASNKKILFTGDLSWDLKENDFPGIENEDYVICELAHFGFETIKKYLDTFNGKAIYFNHVSGIEKFKQLEEIKNNYKYEMIIPSDEDYILID